MGNARMRAEQINYGASNVKVALDDLDPQELIALSARMDTIEAWKATVKTEEKTGASVEYTSALALDAVSVAADIVATQDLHGYDKPWVGGAGANKWDEVWELGGITSDTGEDTPSNDRIRSKNYIAVTPSADYYLAMPNYGVWVYCYDANKGYISHFNRSAGGSFTIPTNCYFIRFVAYAEYGTTYGNNIAINYPATLTTYSPYANICPITGFSTVTITDVDSESHTATVTVALGSTVYGGTLNLTTGELTVTHAIVDLGSLSWVYGAVDTGHPYGYFYTTGIVDKKAGQTNFISSAYTIGNDFLHDKTILGNANNFAVYVIDSTYNDAATFKAAISGYKIVYELAAPTTTTLTAAQLEMVKGYNRISANSGDITIKAYTGAPWGGDEA